jgi:hypothetical protein
LSKIEEDTVLVTLRVFHDSTLECNMD